MNRRIGKLALAFFALYVVLFAQLNLIQVGRKSTLDGDIRNTRQTVKNFNEPRGDIVTSDGVVIATSLRS